MIPKKTIKTMKMTETNTAKQGRRDIMDKEIRITLDGDDREAGEELVKEMEEMGYVFDSDGNLL